MERLYTEITNHIRVTVQPEYLEQESDPKSGVFSFAYTVRIENFGVATVQLLRRKWHITSSGAPFNDVAGDGVVGEQPVLQAGEGFVYTSWSVIKDPVGAMVGAYTFTSETGETFDVAIPEFDLVYPGAVH